MISKKQNEEKKKKYSEEEIDWYTIWKKYILILFLINMSYQKTYTFWYSVVSYEVPSTSSQTIEQSEDNQEEDILGVS